MSQLRIKDFTTKVGSGKTPRGGAEVYQDQGIPLFRSQNVTNEGLLLDDIAYISENIDEEMAFTRTKSLDVLLNITGASLGRCYYIPNDFVRANVNQHVCIIRPIQKIVITTYLYYLIVSPIGQEQIKIALTGGNRDGLSFEVIKNLSFNIPSILEQQNIVEYLDSKCCKIDASVATLKEMKEKYLSLKKSLINETVCRGLNKNVPLKSSGIDWVGDIPEHWEVKRMKSLFEEKKDLSETGKEDLLSVSEYYGVAKRVDKMTDDDIYESRADTLVGYKLCQKGDLVVNIMLAWKKGLGISDFNGIVSPAYAVFKSKKLEPHYYHYLLRSDKYIAEFRRHSKGIIDSRWRLYPERFYNIIAITPPLAEQQSIAKYLDDKCSKIDSIVANIDSQIEVYTRLKKSLISEVVTGKKRVI